jgi:hypothetical protein
MSRSRSANSGNKYKDLLLSLFGAMGEAGIQPTTAADVGVPGGVGPLTVDQTVKLDQQPFTATNIFAKPGVAQANAQLHGNKLLAQNQSNINVQEYERMTPLFLDRLKQQGLIDNETKLLYEKALIDPEFVQKKAAANSTINRSQADDEAYGVRVKGEEEIGLDQKREPLRRSKLNDETLAGFGVLAGQGNADLYQNHVVPDLISALGGEATSRGVRAKESIDDSLRAQETKESTFGDTKKAAQNNAAMAVRASEQDLTDFDKVRSNELEKNRLLLEGLGLSNMRERFVPLQEGTKAFDITTGRSPFGNQATSLLGGYTSKTTGTTTEQVKPAAIQTETKPTSGQTLDQIITVNGVKGRVIDGVFYPLTKVGF